MGFLALQFLCHQTRIFCQSILLLTYLWRFLRLLFCGKKKRKKTGLPHCICIHKLCTQAQHMHTDADERAHMHTHTRMGETGRQTNRETGRETDRQMCSPDREKLCLRRSACSRSCRSRFSPSSFTFLSSASLSWSFCCISERQTERPGASQPYHSGFFH